MGSCIRFWTYWCLFLPQRRIQYNSESVHVPGLYSLVDLSIEVLRNKFSKAILMQDGAAPHTALSTRTFLTEAARGLGVLVKVGFSWSPMTQGVWGAGPPTAGGPAGGETGRFLRARTALYASKPHYFALKLCLPHVLFICFLNFISRNETYTDVISDFTERAKSSIQRIYSVYITTLTRS